MITKIFKSLPHVPLLYTAFRSISLADQKLKLPIAEADPEMAEIIEKEKLRQRNGVNLIASENFVARAVLEAEGSVFCNKYSEGYSGARFYGGNEFVDQSESLCIKRALQLFKLDPKKWGVNVQALSGSPANFQVYTALLHPHDRIMNLDLPHGGHLSHGYQTDTKKVAAPSIYFETMPYRLNTKTGLINYDQLEVSANLFRPKIIIAGFSAYPRTLDFKRFRKICDQVGAFLMVDMAHIAGLIAAEVIPSPFPYADIVTTTTHKTLRGPRGAMIFHKLKVKRKDELGKEATIDIKNRIDNAVFPACQGGPHDHTIAALSTALKLALEPEFKLYQQQVLKNSKRMADELLKRNYTLISGGTENHLVLINMKKSKDVDGARVEFVLDQANIYVNKNTIPGDKSAYFPSGMRIGSPALTTRGLLEDDISKLMEFFDRGVEITKSIMKEAGSKISEFKAYVRKNVENIPGLQDLKKEVSEFIANFDIPN